MVKHIDANDLAAVGHLQKTHLFSQPWNVSWSLGVQNVQPSKQKRKWSADWTVEFRALVRDGEEVRTNS